MEEFICLGCGKTFRRPVPVSQRWTWEAVPENRELRLGSPCCGEGYVPAQACENCGRPLAQGDSLHGLCPDCAQQTLDRFCSCLEQDYSGPEREVLNDAFDGVPLTDPRSGTLAEWK